MNFETRGAAGGSLGASLSRIVPARAGMPSFDCHSRSAVTAHEPGDARPNGVCFYRCTFGDWLGRAVPLTGPQRMVAGALGMLAILTVGLIVWAEWMQG